MFRRYFLPLAFLAISELVQAVTPLPSLGEPAVSPDHSEIAFVSGGDIWTVPSKGGEARLLVSHPATESRPLYSPDGTKLAFTSTRTGAGDIYVLTLGTGELKRLTYTETPDLLDNWSHDGQWLYFSSAVNEIAGNNDIFRVNVNGGTPLEIVSERFYNEFRGAPSPDGKQVAYVAKGLSFAQWWRHGHSHLDESEIWMKDITQKGKYQRIVEEDAKQGWPMWSADGHALFYMSDRIGAENVFRQALDGRSASRQVTKFTDGRLLWPSISYDGKEIVFERNFTIWKLDAKSGTTELVPIILRGAVPSPEITHQQVTQFTALTLSPDGKKVALVAHGEIFAASAKDGGEAIRITRTAAPKSSVHWSSDSNKLIYVSARNGHEQIFEYDVTKTTERQLTNAGEDDEEPTYSPDGKLLAFVRGDRELHVLNLATVSDQRLATGDLQDPTIAWSPDSKYIAYPTNGTKAFRNVNIVAAAGGAAQPVSFLANGETADRISWSPDTKYLLFDTAQRTEPSQIARVDLTPHLPKFREDQFRDLFKNDKTTPENPPAKPGATSGDIPKKTEPVHVVFEGIRNRLTILPLGFDAHEPVISPDGKILVFAALNGNQINLYSYSLDELSKEPAVPRQLTSTSTPKRDYQFSPDSKELYYLDGGRIQVIQVETHTPKPLNVTAALDVNFDADKIAAFEEGWALLNKRFYDSKFHGQDWQHLHDVYAPYVAGSRNPVEMRRVVNLMIGELNASHSGISGPSLPAPNPVGRIGLRFEREPYEAGKGLVIREVLPLTPAALEGTIKAGEILLAVDGEPVGPQTNLDSLLENKVDRRVVLQIGALQIGAANAAQKRDAIVRPISLTAENGLVYRSWVEANRAYVERISDGKLGYVHMADMGSSSLTQLYIDLDVQNQTKQGVVIDIRDNRGGFVNGYALDVFTRKNYLTMTPRGSSPAPSRAALGQRALGLPTVLLTNQGSLSDAEDFTEGYRTLKLGKVVGEPTAGWIIYTDGRQLIDGSVIREPFIRIQGADGKTMEMNPRPVDVPVERLAGESEQGKDSQLERAAKELLSELR
jgi:Tol biopolymer transport system component/C-terminal processing protease CtpA/Prc